MHAHLIGTRNDITSEIVLLFETLLQQVTQRRGFADVDTHGGNVGFHLRLSGRQPQDGGVHLHGGQCCALGLLRKLYDPSRSVDLHQPKGGSFFFLARKGSDGDVGACTAMRQHEFRVVHSIEMISGQDEEIFYAISARFLEQPHVLSYGICSALEPFLRGDGLRGGQHFDKAARVVAPYV